MVNKKVNITKDTPNSVKITGMIDGNLHEQRMYVATPEVVDRINTIKERIRSNTNE